MKRLPARLFATLLILFGAGTSPLGATPDEVAVGASLRNVPMQGLTGDSRFLGDYLGKPLLINVWASYCPPCLAEMGSLERLYRSRRGKLEIIGISIDDYRDRAELFLNKAGTSFAHYIDYQLTLENMLGGNRIPLTVVVGADGKIRQKVYGAREWDSAESQALIDKALAAPAAK